MTLGRIARVAAVALLLLLPATLAAELRFTRHDLGGENTVLFELETRAPGLGNYTTLFAGRLTLDGRRSGTLSESGVPASKKALRLTFFPEQLEIFRDPTRIQLRNRFGTVRSEQEPDRFRPVTGLDEFPRDKATLPAGKLDDSAFSPDGRYVARLEPVSGGFGRLVLVDLESGERTEIAEQVERRSQAKPALWSPRGDALVYARGGSLYLFSVRHHEAGREFAESYRRIGFGQKSSVRWTEDSRLLYLSGSVLYRLRTESFFTRALYQSHLTIGTVLGRLPHRFDPGFDRFWPSLDERELLIARGGNTVSLYSLEAKRDGSDVYRSRDGEAMPYMSLPRDGRVHRVLWDRDGRVTMIVAHGRANPEDHVVAADKRLYRLPAYDAGEDRRFHAVDVPGLRDAALSPNGRKIALLSERQVVIRDHETWHEHARFTHYRPLHAGWLDENRVVIAGRYLIEKLRVAEHEQRFLAFSQAERFGYDVDRGTEVLLQSRYSIRRLDPRALRYDEPAVSSEAIDRFAVRTPRETLDTVRVYTEQFQSGRYDNRLLARDLRTLQTREVFPLPEPEYEPFPERDEPVSFRNFTHGSRVRAREVAFVFNAVDSSLGLDAILETLAQYNITATFFVNGDFIRREPEAARMIAESRHEVGSLFYTHFDFSRARFQIDAQFVQRGLARNEDHYHALTGGELASLWHAPFYFSNATIIGAGADIGYTYVGRDVDSLDWVPARSDSGVPRLYRRSADLVDRIIDRKQPGSIIAMTIGSPNETKPYGGREDYLFQYLDVLIDTLIERGYRIVPVSTLIERAR